MKTKLGIIIVWLIVILFIIHQGLNVISNEVIEPINEPVLSDKFNGNWTATWELQNPNNYTFSNIDLIEGKAELRLHRINLIENKITQFRNVRGKT